MVVLVLAHKIYCYKRKPLSPTTTTWVFRENMYHKNKTQCPNQCAHIKIFEIHNRTFKKTSGDCGKFVYVECWTGPGLVSHWPARERVTESLPISNQLRTNGYITCVRSMKLWCCDGCACIVRVLTSLNDTCACIRHNEI